MSNLATRHPTDDQLLRFADGELPRARAEEIQKHLRTCWQCRSELEEIERTIGECVRYGKIVLEGCSPPPPAPWFDIYGGLAGIDDSWRRRHLARRILESLGAVLRNPSRWVPATAIVVLIAFVVEQFHQAPSVKAAELLHKAVAADGSRPPVSRRIQIRTRAQRITRVVGSARSLIQAGAGADSSAGLESLFHAAHYSWEDPLSAKSFSEWRDQLADKRDEVTSEGDRYRLKTTTGSGELVQATLELSSTDLRAVEGTLEFRNRESVEISELPDVPVSTPKASKEATETSLALPSSRPTPDQRATFPRWAATPGEELQVMDALHQLGADLGDPIEVTRSGNHILVVGMGITPERQQEIREGLKAIPRVTLLFPEPSAEVRVREGPGLGSSISVRPGRGQGQAELERQLGGRAAFEQFSDQVLQLTDSFMSRAYALRRLAERFPSEREAQMTPQQHQLLAKLCREHAEALLQSVIDVQNRLQPVVTKGVPGASQEAVTSATWQDGAEQLAGAARRFENSLVSILGGVASEARSQELMAELVDALTQLRGQAENYKRLTPGR